MGALGANTSLRRGWMEAGGSAPVPAAAAVGNRPPAMSWEQQRRFPTPSCVH